MDIVNPGKFFEDFPRLKGRPRDFRETSKATPRYNCIAWAMGDDSRCWWPSRGFYWPPNCRPKTTINEFKKAFATRQYKPCENGELEEGYEKIALYALKQRPTHAARQLKNGRWTSKLGGNVDIEHGRPEDLEEGVYGKVVCYFRRRSSDTRAE